MNRLSQLIVKLRYVILIAAVALLIPSAIGYFNTRVNYDILTYLPKDIETMKGQDILLDQFGTGAFVLYVAEGDILRDYILPQGASRDSAEIVHQGFESASVEITGHVHKLRADDHVALCHAGARIVNNDIQQSHEGIRVIKGTEIFDDGFLFQGCHSFPKVIYNNIL